MSDRMSKERLDNLVTASEDVQSHPITFAELVAEIRASWAEYERRLRAELASESECDNLKAALVKRTGASSFEEWAGDWDPTEETPIEYIGRLRKELAEARLIPDAMDQLQRELAEARASRLRLAAELEAADRDAQDLRSALAEARKDTDRLNYLEIEMELERESLKKQGPTYPALFRRNALITRTTIDAARTISATNNQQQPQCGARSLDYGSRGYPCEKEHGHAGPHECLDKDDCPHHW